jgi:hypothetical protein
MNEKVIKCETINIYRNKKTGKTYETKEAYLKENSEEDLAVDLTVKVPTLIYLEKLNSEKTFIFCNRWFRKKRLFY